MGATHYLYWAHVAKGIYTMQLERWFSLLGRENVKVSPYLCNLRVKAGYIHIIHGQRLQLRVGSNNLRH